MPLQFLHPINIPLRLSKVKFFLISKQPQRSFSIKLIKIKKLIDTKPNLRRRKFMIDVNKNLLRRKDYANNQVNNTKVRKIVMKTQITNFQGLINRIQKNIFANNQKIKILICHIYAVLMLLLVKRRYQNNLLLKAHLKSMQKQNWAKSKRIKNKISRNSKSIIHLILQSTWLMKWNQCIIKRRNKLNDNVQFKKCYYSQQNYDKQFISYHLSQFYEVSAQLLIFLFQYQLLLYYVNRIFFLRYQLTHPYYLSLAHNSFLFLHFYPF